jgi:hypothetical protein
VRANSEISKRLATPALRIKQLTVFFLRRERGILIHMNAYIPGEKVAAAVSLAAALRNSAIVLDVTQNLYLLFIKHTSLDISSHH